MMMLFVCLDGGVTMRRPHLSSLNVFKPSKSIHFRKKYNQQNKAAVTQSLYRYYCCSAYLFHIDLFNCYNKVLLCLETISQILVTCGFEAEVLMGLAAVSGVSRDEVKEEEMMFVLT